MPDSVDPDDLLTRLGWDDRWAAMLGPTALRPARVTRVDRGLYGVLGAAGPDRHGLGPNLLEAAAHDPLDGPCVGDWVTLRDWPDDRVTIDAVLPRRTVLVRAQVGGTSHEQALAANVTTTAVVAGLDQQPSMTKLERLIALAWESGAAPVVLLTKADLARDADDVAADLMSVAPGIEVICCSVLDGRGIERVRELAAAGTVALVGSSGAGKSTLINELVGADVLATRDIRSDGRGRHTSVRRELVLLPSGGCLVDTPGLRGVGLSDTGEGLAATFADVEALIAQCRFTDCAHETEPDCAVRAALDDGRLDVRRYESWQKLQREVAWMARRKDARLRADELKRWKRRTKDQRSARHR
ncbi:ribosome small subunit-dependent GTPase A [Solicola gregarius]|uniref:Small ribosomal subunit biogenesis GTPase RsgA n=1 Tax=Solicola gregarius TaxID=2908642 RepID=A0AA46YKR9_9ACTN|nr:ribosome small subunit-dependent GTPase A [Solicola gregarius]UYM04781.1 ribosome small subunit-dependent GTPase A [Solicola gregarius]